MYYLYAVNKISDAWNEIPYEKREWWFLAYSNSDKQAVLDWHTKFKRDYSYKIVCSNRTLKECFYPRAEIKKRTQTAQLLKSLKYGEKNDY